MSSILKALKKLERERALRLDTPLELGRDILRGETRRRRGAFWLGPLLSGVVLLGLGFGGWWLLRPAPATAPLRAADPLPGGLTVLTASRADAVVVEELVERRRPAAVAPLAPRPVARPAVPPSSVAPGVPAAAAVAVPALTAASPPPSPPAAGSETVPADPGLVVQAIAFSPRREERLAVINELPVMEGTAIGAFMVEEILSDRVVLRRGAATLTLSLDRP